ncbi:MAG: type I restriction enzyme HsdR N-terminal domain-containing protein [Lachnospiraceae bacterium]|nr:type I restriction enzyme HsdR N-terminal domain-containing protein [Lachnospiraceae bacterium]
MDLSVDQIRIINSKTSGQSLIKGVAGSGKTTVALFKLVAMQQLKEMQNEKVLVVTYNKTLIKYMTYLCQEYGVSIDDKKVSVKTIDSVIYSVLPEDIKKIPIAKDGVKREKMKLAIQKVQEQHPNSTILQDKNVQFLLEEIEWIKGCMYLKKEEYMDVDRLGRNSIGENRMRLLKRSENRAAIFDTFVMYEKLLRKANLIDYTTRAVRALNKMKSGEIRPKKYRYIIVDESQDLSRAQLEIIRNLYEESEKSNIIFIADVAQSIYSQSWLSKQSFKSVGFDMSGKSNVLSKNYRTTKEIALAAYSLINNDKDLKMSSDYVEPESIERNGARPQYRHFEEQVKEFAYITEEIKKCAIRYRLGEIVVVARNKGYLETLKDYFLKHGIDAELAKELEKSEISPFCVDKIKLFTLHSIKGLEASVVFIAGVNDGILPYSTEMLSVERKLLYVGMTRAKEMLYVTSSKKESVYIGEIESKYLRLSDDEEEECFSLSIEDYQFFDRVEKTINNEEEKVRQWYLNQLQTRYGYPIRRMQSEVCVKCGSKTFFVDIGVYKDDEREVPFIYVETKSSGSDLAEALRQVKCYIVPGNAPEYIVVTDGKKQIVKKYMDGTFVACDDIPVCQMEVGEYEIFRYFDFVHGRQMEYKQTTAGESCLRNKENNTALDYTCLPVKGSVAAGNLKYVNEEYDRKEMVPLEAISGPDMKFILEVSGDSMINFNILNGDKIVVRKQSFAKEGNIIVGGDLTTNEATVKQFHYVGENKIILHPGNPKYQDIVIQVEDFYISGVVIGVIRRE